MNIRELIRSYAADTFSTLITSLCFVLGFTGTLLFSMFFFPNLILHWPNGLRGYIMFSGVNLALHMYSTVLYLALFTFVFIPRWKNQAIGYAFVIWMINEWTFNLIYAAAFPYDYHQVFFTFANQMYLGMVAALGILSIILCRPRIKFSRYVFAFPAFLVIWALAGYPLMFVNTGPGIPPNTMNFPWELMYQVTLIASFLGTLKKKEKLNVLTLGVRESVHKVAL